MKFDDEEYFDDTKTSNGNSETSGDISSVVKDRDTSEISRRVDNDSSYNSLYDKKKSREISDSLPSSNCVEMNANPGFNVIQDIQEDPKVTSKILPDTVGKTNIELGASDYKNFALTNVQTVIGNAAENNAINTPKLNINLRDSSSAQNPGPNAASRFSDETINEPLVDLNSGVALTPVACPDEVRVWALGKSDDGESPGNEGGAGLQVTSRLFAGSNRSSPVSR